MLFVEYLIICCTYTVCSDENPSTEHFAAAEAPPRRHPAGAVPSDCCLVRVPREGHVSFIKSRNQSGLSFLLPHLRAPWGGRPGPQREAARFLLTVPATQEAAAQPRDLHPPGSRGARDGGASPACLGGGQAKHTWTPGKRGPCRCPPTPLYQSTCRKSSPDRGLGPRTEA